MPLLTFGDLKNSSVPAAAGVCATSDEFRDITNKSVSMLMTRGSFYGTVEKIQICIYNDCLTYPRYVGTVLATNTCRHPRDIWNNWWSFLPLSRSDFGPGGFTFGSGSCGGSVAIEDANDSPVFQPIRCGSNVYLRAYPSVLQDVGKIVTFFGIDSNGQVVRTLRSDGTWQDGVQVTLALPFVSTPMQFRTVFRITKEVTQSIVRYYQYDPVNNVLLDLVTHDPSETTPMYRSMRIRNADHCLSGCATSCAGLKSIESMVKLQFIPVVNDLDIVLIGNMNALAYMIISNRKSDQGDSDEASKYELKAIRELNLELREKFPEEKTPIQINAFGSAIPARSGIGRIL